MRMTRPRLFGIAIGIAIFAAIMIVQAVTSGGDEQPAGEVTPAATVAAVASGTSEPGATIPAPTAAPLSGPIDDGFVRTALAAEETPHQPNGIVFVDMETGKGEYWRVASAKDVLGEAYLVDPSHRWLSWTDLNAGRQVIADRESGKSYEYHLFDWGRVAGPAPEAVLILRRN